MYDVDLPETDNVKLLPAFAKLVKNAHYDITAVCLSPFTPAGSLQPLGSASLDYNNHHHSLLVLFYTVDLEYI